MVARLSRHLEVALAEVDLSPSQYRILGFLDQGGAAASALAEKLAVTRPSITAVVDGLVSRGLVERQSDPDDRRRVGHVLTAQGRKVLTQADDALDHRLSEIASCAPDRSEADVLQGLDLLRHALDGHWAAKVAPVIAAETGATA